MAWRFEPWTSRYRQALYITLQPGPIRDQLLMHSKQHFRCKIRFLSMSFGSCKNARFPVISQKLLFLFPPRHCIVFSKYCSQQKFPFAVKSKKKKKEIAVLYYTQYKSFFYFLLLQAILEAASNAPLIFPPSITFLQNNIIIFF